MLSSTHSARTDPPVPEQPSWGIDADQYLDSKNTNEVSVGFYREREVRRLQSVRSTVGLSVTERFDEAGTIPRPTRQYRLLHTRGVGIGSTAESSNGFVVACLQLDQPVVGQI
jgi:hypothetical protein